jgi:hypothetical protein
MQIYTALLARSSAILKTLPIPIVTGDQCPQCEAHCPLRAHSFYTRTLVDLAFDGMIRVRRYLCGCCQRALSLRPEFALPYLPFGIVVIALYLVARPTHV